MKADGLPERVTDIVPKQGTDVFSYQSKGQDRFLKVPPADIIEAQRLLHTSFILYQSTHRTVGISSGVLFPYAWLLEEGDTVWNSTLKEEYTIKNPQELNRGYRDPLAGGQYPDPTELRHQNYRFPKIETMSQYPDIKSREGFHLQNPSIPPDRGEVGFVVTLINKDGQKVRPEESDVLYFRTDRYLQMVPKNRAKHKSNYVPDPDNDRDLEEIASKEGPIIQYSTRRIEPASRSTQEFGSRKAGRPVHSTTVGHPDEPNILYQVYSQLMEFTNRYEIIAPTQYESEKAFSYTLVFFIKNADILRLNGIKGLTFWQALPTNYFDNSDNIGFNLDIYFKVEYLDSRIETVRKEVRVGAYENNSTRQEDVLAKSAPVQ